MYNVQGVPKKFCTGFLGKAQSYFPKPFLNYKPNLYPRHLKKKLTFKYSKKFTDLSMFAKLPMAVRDVQKNGLLLIFKVRNLKLKCQMNYCMKQF